MAALLVLFFTILLGLGKCENCRRVLSQYSDNTSMLFNSISSIFVYD